MEKVVLYNFSKIKLGETIDLSIVDSTTDWPSEAFIVYSSRVKCRYILELSID